MSLLQRVAEQQGAAQQEANGVQREQAAENAKPNAVEDANKQRQGYSDALKGAPAQDMQEEQPDPEEQQMFTQGEKAIAEMIYGPKASDQIIKAVMGGQDPVQGVGKMAREVVRAAEEKVQGLSEDAIFALGESAVEQIVDLVESSNPEVDMSQAQMAEAMSIGVGLWMQDNPGEVGAKEEYLNGAAPEQLAPQGAPQEQAAPPQEQAAPPIQGV
jgi:hypothetical protein